MKRAGEMTDPGPGESFSIEDTNQDLGVRMREVAEWIAANPTGHINRARVSH
jgi:hypothetical protein